MSYVAAAYDLLPIAAACDALQQHVLHLLIAATCESLPNTAAARDTLPIAAVLYDTSQPLQQHALHCLLQQHAIPCQMQQQQVIHCLLQQRHVVGRSSNMW